MLKDMSTKWCGEFYMITREVNDWLKKLETTNYPMEEAMKDLAEFSRYLSREDLIFIKRKLKNIFYL